MPYITRNVKDASPVEITCGIMRKLTDAKDHKGMDVVHVTIIDSTKKHYHKTLTEIYYVLKGSIEVELDGKREHLNEGQMVMIYPNTHHKAWKTSEENAEILVVCLPPWAKEDEILLE
ncbi:MAG TPA: cupin domain-containing protein [archaeon]|nr:cupin domain-containing protein [archaeon]